MRCPALSTNPSARPAAGLLHLSRRIQIKHSVLLLQELLLLYMCWKQSLSDAGACLLGSEVSKWPGL